jgi:catechol 2,3-dioxygenase
MVTLGHVVFYVRNLEQSLTFYRDVVGLEIVGQIFDGRAAMLTGGTTHHELLLIEVGNNAPGPLAGHRIGLYHVGWKIGESLAELRKARDRILAQGHTIDGLSDHTVSQSIYLHDPDGNEIELFVDDPRADWKNSQKWLQKPVKPLRL